MRRTVPGIVLLAAFHAAAAGAQTSSLEINGLVDLVAASGRDALAMNMFNKGDTMFDPYRLRLYVAGDMSPGLHANAQVTFSEVGGAAAEGAWLVWTPKSGRDLHVQAGKTPWPIGTYGPRTYSDENPLVGTPLMYQYHTTLRMDAIPPNADALLAAAGTGQYGPDYGAGRGFRGMPIAYDHCWDFGVALVGSARPFEFSLGFGNGTPSAPSAGPDGNDGKSVLGRIGISPRPELRLGVSGGYGPYLPNKFASAMPAGKSVEDFNQRLYMADAEFLFGHLEARAEGYFNTWETPTVGDLDVTGGYAELRATVTASGYVAARYDLMRFGELAGTTTPSQPWDHDRDRVEAGIGYRAARRATLKGVFQRNTEHLPNGASSQDDLYAVALSLGF